MTRAGRMGARGVSRPSRRVNATRRRAGPAHRDAGIWHFHRAIRISNAGGKPMAQKKIVRKTRRAAAVATSAAADAMAQAKKGARNVVDAVTKRLGKARRAGTRLAKKAS